MTSIPITPALEALAPYEQFHGRGLEATAEVAGPINVGPNHQIPIVIRPFLPSCKADSRPM